MLTYPIMLQQRGRLVALQPKNHGIEACQHHFTDTVVIVPLLQTHMGCHGLLEPDPSQKAMQEIYAPIMHQAVGSEDNAEFSRPLGIAVNPT